MRRKLDRSSFGCGRSVRLQAYPIGGPASMLLLLPDNRDFTTSYAVDNGDATTDVYFDPFRCGGKANIVKVTTPTPT